MTNNKGRQQDIGEKPETGKQKNTKSMKQMDAKKEASIPVGSLKLPNIGMKPEKHPPHNSNLIGRIQENQGAIKRNWKEQAGDKVSNE